MEGPRESPSSSAPGTTKATLRRGRSQQAFPGAKEGRELPAGAGKTPQGPPRFSPRRLRESQQNRKRPHRRRRGLRKFPLPIVQKKTKKKKNGKATAGLWGGGLGRRFKEKSFPLRVSLSFKGNSLVYAQRPCLPSIHPSMQPCAPPPPDSIPSQFPSVSKHLRILGDSDPLVLQKHAHTFVLTFLQSGPPSLSRISVNGLCSAAHNRHLVSWVLL